jgi:hypothetical protein
MAKKKLPELSEEDQAAVKAKESERQEIADIRERFEKIVDLRNKDFKRYKDDIRFLYLDHWDAQTRAERDADKRITLQVDKLLQYRNQVVNDSRMNRPQIKVTPIQGGAQETAEVFDGMIRHIQDISDADIAYDTALGCAVDGGFGYIRLIHDYAHEGADVQEIYIDAVSNPLAVYFGQYKKPDGSDVTEVFIIEDVPKDEFEAEYPKASLDSFSSEGQKYGDWIGENIRVAERYWVVKEPRIMNKLPDGSEIADEDYQLAKAQLPPGMQMPPIVDARMVKTNVVRWAKLYGAGYLEKPQDTIWCGIPVIPVWGNVQNIDGEVMHVGMFHRSKDAQLLYDYSRSAFAERVGLTPEAPTQAPAGSIENYLDEWDGTKRVRVQRYDHLDDAGNPFPAPQRQQPTDIPTGFSQDMQLSEHDIQGTLGMYQASLGRQGNATSGIQEREQARKGDVATFHFHDNVARGLKALGKLIVYGIPKVYDTKRMIRILGVDGTADQAQLDPQSPVPYQKVGNQAVYNLALGIYGVTVSAGPSYQTRRQEAAAQMAQIAASDPQFMPMYGDLFFKAQDWPFADELAKRAKLLLPPQIQQAEENDSQSPEVQAAQAQAKAAIAQRDQQVQAIQQALQAAGEEIKKLKQQEASDQRDLMIKDAEIRLKDKELLLKAFEAETKRQQVASDWEEAQLMAAKDVTVANIAAKSAKDAADMAADQAADAVFTEDMGQKAPEEGQPKKQRPGDAILERLAQHEQMFAQLHEAIMAPRKKTARAVKMPDGSIHLESVETLQ